MRIFELLHPGGFVISSTQKLSQFFTLLLFCALATFPNLELYAADYVSCTNGLISNWSFENSTNGWTCPNGTNFERKSNWSACGNYGLSIDNGNGIGELISNPVAASAGKTYNIFFWSGTHDTSYDHLGYLEFLNGSGTVIGSESVIIEHDIDSNSSLAWYAITATAPANTASVRFKATCSGNYLKIDCVCLTEVPECDPVVPETCNAEYSCNVIDNDITGRSFWTDAYGVFSFVNGGKLEYCANDVAYLTGEIAHVANSSDSWKIYIKLVDPLSYDELIAAGGAPVNPGYGDASTWMYYIVSNESRLFGTNSNCGKLVNVSHRPSDLTKRVQIGDGANLQDAGLGMSSWFGFSGDWVCNGDINADLSGCSVVCDMALVAPEDFETDCNASLDPSETGYPTYDMNCGTCGLPEYSDVIISEDDCRIITERTWTISCDVTELLPETTIGYWNFDDCDASGPSDCCDDGKPVIITMLFQGNDCSATSNDQGSNDSCSGSTDGVASAYIVASKRSDGTEAYFAGTVTVGDEFVINASTIGATEIKSNTYIFAYTSQGGSLLQEVVFHTSCSVPLKGGDVYGGFKIHSMLMTSGNTCSGGEEYTVYDEFNGIGSNPECAVSTLSNVKRNNPTVNHHSCVDGYNGSSAGMCVTAESGNSPAFNDLLVEFDVTIDPSNTLELTTVQFYMKAPTEIIWQNNSNQGSNNYPQKYAIRVLKESTTVFEQIDILTTRDWSLQSFDLSNDVDFVINSAVTYTIQITAYDPIGISGVESLWDIDELFVKGKCTGSAAIRTSTDTQIITQYCSGELECPNDVTINCDETKDPSNTGEPTLNCDINVTTTYVDNVIEENCPQVIERTWTATYSTTDGSTSSTTTKTFTCTQLITVVDNVAPTITGVPGDVTIACEDDIPAKSEDVVGDDNCWANVSYAEVITGDVPCDYTITRTWTVTDDCGNAVSDDQVITIKNDLMVMVTDDLTVCKDETASLNAEASKGCGTYSYNWSGPSSFSSTDQTITAIVSGTYTVTVTDGSGCTASDASKVIIEDKDEITGIVWIDQNGNGCQDLDEPIVRDISIALYECDEDGSGGFSNGIGTLVDETTTDINGVYRFVDCYDPRQQYFLQIRNIPAGFVLTNPFSDDCSNDQNSDANTDDGKTGCMSADGGIDDKDFGLLPSMSVGSTVFADLDDDGIKEDTEPGIQGVLIEVFNLGDNGIAEDGDDEKVGEALTNAQGNYLIGGLEPGKYYVKINTPSEIYPYSSADTDVNANNDEDNDDNGIQNDGKGAPVWSGVFELVGGDEPEGNEETGSGSAQDDADDANGNMTIDFGFYAPASVGDKVFADMNGDGIQDTGEAGIDGITVKLKDENGDVIDETITAEGGLYLFDELAPGTYSVMFVLGDGQEFSPLNAGTNDSVDSDANPAMGGMTEVFDLESGEDRDDVDAGIFFRGEVCIYTFKDCDNNGDLRGDEALSNVPFDYLYTDVNGAQINGFGLTDETGVACITLRPGSIDIRIFFPTSPTGLSFTDANIVDDAFDSDANANGEIPTIVITSGSSTEVAAGFKDIEKPTLINVPSDAVYECDAVEYPKTPTVTDNCDDEVYVTRDSTITAGDCPQEYTIEYVWTAKDACGNETKDWTTIKVQDTKAPVAKNQPEDITVECGDPIPSFDPEWKDNCSDKLEISAISSTSYDGCTEVQTMKYTAIDECGNEASISRKVTIVDTKKPEIINVPSDIVAECDEVVYPGTPKANDLCDGYVEVTRDSTITRGDCPQEYTIEYVWTAKDKCGNESKAWTTLKVQDTKAPVAKNRPEDITVECGDPIPSFDPEWKDNCSEKLEISAISSTSYDGCTEVQTMKYTAIDKCGNEASVSRKVTIVDTKNPEIINVPSDIVAECDEVVYPETPKANDLCDGYVEVTRDSTITRGDCPQEYTIEYVWTAKDKCGNESKAWTTLKVQDTKAPVAKNQPEDITVECGDPVPSFDPKWKDNCSEDLKFEAKSSTRIDGCTEIQEFTYSATDECGNTASVSRTVTIVDSKKPEFGTIPSSTTHQCDAVVYPKTPRATDLCDPNVVVQRDSTILPGRCPQEFMINYTWTAIDACGNEAKEYTTIKVVDTTDPELINVPSDATYECDEVVYPVTPNATDNCDDDVYVTRDSTITRGDCPQEYTIEYVWIAKDDCGNETKDWTTIKVQDTKAPVAENQPEDITVECGDPVPSFDPKWKDNCSEDLKYDAKSSTSIDGCTEIQEFTYSATDECGNTASVTRTVKIVDTKKPEFGTIPSDVTYECHEVKYPATPKATDLCDPNVVVQRDSTILPGRCPQEFMINYTWTATDACGNETKEYTTIKVVDTTDPELINVPSDATYECDAVVYPVTPNATDNCDDDVYVTRDSTITAGDCPQEYTIEYVWTAKDDCGNETKDWTTIKVQDTKAPVAENQPEDITVECGDPVPSFDPNWKDNCSEDLKYDAKSSTSIDGCTEIQEFTYSATDECGNTASVTRTVKIVDTKKPEFGTIPSDATYECHEVKYPATPKATDLCDPNVVVQRDSTILPGRCPKEFEINYTWTATDACGNETKQYTTIKVVDTTDPELINVPSDATYECDAVVYPVTPNATDNCDDDVYVTRDSTITAGDCPQEYTIEYVWTAKDACGNETKDWTTIKIQDTEGPVAMNPPTDAVINCGENIPPYDPMWKDNCSVELEISVKSSTGTTDCGEEQEYVYTATDECGNTSEIRRKVKIVDTEKPYFDGLVPDKRISCDEPIEFGTPAFADNCGIPTLTHKDDRKPGRCPNEYVITRTWTITDYCGNSATTSANITVWDTDAPGLLNVPRDATFECDNVKYPTTPKAVDNCNGYVVVNRDSFIVISEECPQNITITYTWTALDECGNTASDKTVIKIQDTTAPVIGDIPQDLLVQLVKGEKIPEIQDVEVTDNCDPSVEVKVDEKKVPTDCGYILKRTWTAVDACGNEAESKTQEIKVIDGIEAEISPAIIEVCEGYSAEFTASPTGENYLYEWTVSGGGTLLNANESTVTFTGQTGGAFTITVKVSSKDAPDCFGETTAIVKVRRLPRASISNNGPICLDRTIQLGATGGLTYEWTGPNGFVSMEQNPIIENANSQNVGTYTVVITEEECATTLTTEVELYENPEIEIENNSPVCEGETVILKASGGTDYMWMDSDDNILATGSTLIIENVQAANEGIYTVIVANDYKCSTEQETEVAITDKPEDIITKVEICQGESYVWDANGMTYTEEDTYHFEGEGCIADQYLKITFKTGGDDVVTYETICPGDTYTWIVTGEVYSEAGEFRVEGQGCYGDQILRLSVKPKDQDEITYASLCEGQSYTWELNGQTYNAEGTYEVLGSGCEADQYLKLTYDSSIYADVDYTSNSGCYDNDGVIKLTPTTNSYAWSDGGSGPDRNDLAAGDYVISATNAEGCTKILKITIGKDCECILPKIEKIETTDISCGEDSGAATILTSQDPSQFVYTWVPNEGTPTDSIGNSRTGLTAGKYDVIVTYAGAKDCFAKATITILEGNSAVEAIADVTNGDCETPGSIILNVLGGDGTYTYDWAHIDGVDNPKDLSDLESGNYAVVVTDGVGCTVELENIVVFRDCDPCDMLEDIRVETKDETCNEKGSARFTPNTYYYTWIHDEVQAEYRSGLNAGNYVVIAQDPMTGCKTELEIVIDFVQPKEATIIVADEILLTCENQDGATVDFEIEYEEGFALPWQVIIADENGQNIPNGSLTAGEYCLYVKDANRCTITNKCITLIAPEGIDLSYEVINAECDLGGAIDLTISTGNGPFIYTWSDGNTNEDRINIDAGSYDVTVVDGNLCETVLKEIVVVSNCDPCGGGSGPEVEVTKMDAGCENNGYIQLIVPTDSDYTYNWADLEGMDNPKDREGLAQGTFNVTVTDNKGCSTIITTIISSNCDEGPTDCDIFDQDELTVTTSECDGGAKICLGVQLQDFKDLQMQLNGQDYAAGIAACNFAVTYSYQFKFLLDATPNGPYELDWSYDDLAFHKDSLNDIAELAEFIIENDPSGNWTYNAEEAFLIGGNEEYDYGALKIFHYETAAKFEININTIFVPSNVEVTLPVGEHEIVIIDSAAECTDTVKVTVVCESTENIVRTITVGDQTMVCLSDIAKGDGTSFENTCPSDLEFALASYNSADDCITFSGNEVGSMQFCYENCDADGNCKTTTITIHVIPVNQRMIFITMVPGEDSTYCFDVADFNLNGDIDQVFLGCEDDDNEAVDFKLNETDDCVEITAVALGEDDACLKVCDDANVCDSLSIIVTVVEPNGGTGPLPNAVDNDTMTTKNKDVTIRAIDNDQVNGTLTNTGVVNQPANGSVTVLPGGVYIYTPDNGFCGEEDHFTYFIENENGTDTAAVNIMVVCDEIIVFSGFSPNDDGVNDKFDIIGIENYPENTVCIFNRWGNQVFSKKGYTNTAAWEGDWNEGDLPDGTYFYVIDLGDGSDKKSGYVQILR